MLRSSFLVASAAAAVAPVAFAGLAQAQSSPLPLRVAATANDTYASAYYAQEKGFFTQAGLNVDLVTMGNGAAIASALVGGSIDVGVAVPTTIAIAYLRGLPFVIIAAGALSVPNSPAIRLGVEKTSPIKTAKDLEGKTVGINAVGIGMEPVLHAWMAPAGGDFATVHFVEIPFAEMGVALARGTVDAAIMSEPGYSIGVRQDNVKMLADLDLVIGTHYLNSVWFTTRTALQQQTEAMRRFVRAIYAAQRWANAHEDQSAEILSQITKMDLATVRAMTRSPFADQLHAADVQPMLDHGFKYGILSRPVAATDLIAQF